MPILGNPSITATSMPMLLNYEYGPVAIIEIDLQKRSHIQYQNRAGRVTEVIPYYPSYTPFQLRIPLYVLSRYREPCNFFISNVLSNFNLEREVSDSLAPIIADFAADFAAGFTRGGSFMGFCITADVKVSCFEIVDDPDEAQMELLATMDSEDVVRNKGASRSVIEKLKKERRVDDGGTGSELGTCMVCLEELSGVVELINMSCSHIFHELCICRWLEEKKSCPICRCEVEDDG